MKTEIKTRLASVFLAVFFLASLAVPVHAKVTAVEGELAGEIICLFDWTTKEEYQGSKATCLNPEHDRAFVTEGGEIYILQPDDKASENVIKSIRTKMLERKKVVVHGEIVEGGPVRIIKVKSIEVKE
jgi:hypothetical protein